MPITFNIFRINHRLNWYKGMLFCLCLIIQLAFAQEVQTATESNVISPSSASTVVAPATNIPDAASSTASSSPYYTAAGSSNKVGSGGQLLSVTMALLFIVMLIMAVSWFIRRFGQGVLANTNNMKIVATMPLGTRERVLLVEVGGQQILLGVTATQINTLHVFAEPVIIAPQTQAVPVSEFSRKLMAILQQKNNPSGTASNSNPAGQG